MTIDCVSVATAHLFGDALASQFRLRHRIFIERRAWTVPSWEGMEFDQFDTPATTYFIWRDAAGEARGIARIAPTQLPYMLEVLWPDMITKEPLPRDSRIWEGSRLGVDDTVEPELRRRILGELFAAYLEFCLLKDIDRFLVLMPVAFLRRTLAGAGWPPQVLGPVKKFGRAKVAAASLKVSPKILENVRASMGLEGSVLRTAEELLKSKAA